MTLEFIIGKDNTQKIKLWDDNTGSMTATNTVAINRVTLEFGDYIADSNDDASYFDWSSHDGIIIINIGNLPNLLPGTWLGDLTVYDAVHEGGIQWSPKIQIKVI